MLLKNSRWTPWVDSHNVWEAGRHEQQTCHAQCNAKQGGTSQQKGAPARQVQEAVSAEHTTATPTPFLQVVFSNTSICQPVAGSSDPEQWPANRQARPHGQGL
jgi:hypothetical protein